MDEPTTSDAVMMPIVARFIALWTRSPNVSRRLRSRSTRMRPWRASLTKRARSRGHRGDQPQEVVERCLAPAQRVNRLIALRHGAVEKRLHPVDQTELRIVLAAESLKGDERLEEEGEIRRQHDRVLAQDRRYPVQQRPDLQILQLRVGIVETPLPRVGGNR